MPEKNIVVLGGSFNPPTIAHLKIMQAAMDAVRADRGYLVPVSFAYLKRKMMKNGAGRICLSDDLRMRMLSAMCREDARLSVSKLELHEIQAVTYHTMSAVSALHPGAKCFFLAGADKLDLIAQWGSRTDFLERFGVIVFCRDGIDIEKRIEETKGLRGKGESLVLLAQPEGVEEISSTAVRRHILAGKSAETYVCPEVWELLKALKPGDFPEEIYRFQDEFAFLSNSFPAAVTWEGLTYPSAEAAFQASISDDENIRLTFTNCSPDKAKQKGSRMQTRAGWEEEKLEIMEAILREKFRQHPHLLDKLLATGNAVLIAGNHGRDTYWGMDLYCWIGENHLGRILMKLREENREGKEGVSL